MNTNKIARGILGMEDIFFSCVILQVFAYSFQCYHGSIMEQQSMRVKAGKGKRTHA